MSRFSYLGWDFREVRGDRKHGVLTMEEPLQNPDEPEATGSYKVYRLDGLHQREMAACWLIAHWWSHYIHSCECQHDDREASNFRWTLYNSLVAINIRN